MDERKTLEERVTFLEGKIKDILMLLFSQDRVNHNLLEEIERLRGDTDDDEPT